ncbi:MAG: hypothetical protein GF401_03495 [Chitinivibrionales bacterium]|nr:hypothetical protein [Chitinivibrionales bacterium]
MRKLFSCRTVMLIGIVSIAYGQDISFDSLSPEITAPVFDARFSIGFNYDLLRAPTDVSFEYPRGYFGINIPIEQSVNPLEIARVYSKPVDSVFSDSALFTDGEELAPKFSARQSPNTSFMIDVPMLGGVCSFSNIENVYLNYLNTLGLPSAKAATSMPDDGISLLMRGAINVPMDFDMSWETMTFGYAYRVNRDLIFALNLHRHVFMFNLRSKINVDILGYADIDQEMISSRIPLNYSLGGAARANYLAEAWSPSFGVKYWRFTITSRFGVDTRAAGFLEADYTLPFFIDPETFDVTLSQDQLLDPAVISQLEQNETVNFKHTTDDDMAWKMPSGHTLAFDIVRDKLNLSYTKVFGDVKMELDSVWRIKSVDEEDSLSGGDTSYVNLDLGVTVDNVIMLSGKWRSAFFNLGVFTMDFAWDDQEHILGDAVKTAIPDAANYILLGDSPMFPVLNFGSALGTKIQLLLELDVLPLLALKTGVYYYF